MPSTNLIISRLQNQRSRIQGMLSPGKKQRQPGGSSRAPLSPVASDFAGRKFEIAAKKMRTLDAGKLGQTLSSGLTSLSADIQSKFADIQKIIHINPGTSRQDNIWSSVETPLPDSQPVRARQETPDEPGVMRSGSVIQKMNMVPKPGQSLSSFKDQIQKQPRTTKKLPEKKPVIGQNTRRFSQVQEVTPGQQLSPPEIPAVPVKPDESQTPQIQAKETPGPATIQSQPDPTAAVSEKPVVSTQVEASFPEPSEASEPPKLTAQPVKKSSLPEMPLRQEPRKSEPVTRTGQHLPLETQPAKRSQEEITLQESQTEKPPQAQLPVQEENVLKAIPVVKKPPVQEELKKALPVKKEQKETQKPVARPTQKSRIQAPVAPVRPTIQRQPQAENLPPSAPVRPVIQQPMDADLPAVTPDRSVIQQQPQESALSAKLPAPPVPSEAGSSSPEMPLQQNISYRQNASRAIRTIAPDQMKPVSQPPLIQREDVPLLTRSKYRTTSIEGSHPELSTKKGPSPLPGQDQPQAPFRVPEALNMDFPPSLASQQVPAPENLLPIPMPLVAHIASPTPVITPPKTEHAKSPVQSQVSQVPRTSSAVPKTNNTIQRAWEGHTPPNQSSSGESEGSNKRAESTDLQALAENVFPYVKRILEIEAERSSGKLR